MRTSKPGQSGLLLVDLVEILEGASVRYAVIGAMAAAVHAAVRASLDADVIVSLAPAEAAKLRDTCEAAGFQTDLRRGDVDDPISALLKVSDTFGNSVDILFGLRGFEKEAFSRTEEVPFQGKAIRIVGREDFIAMKAFAGGPQDICDAERALQGSASNCDLILLRRLTAKYGPRANDILEQLLRG